MKHLKPIRTVWAIALFFAVAIRSVAQIAPSEFVGNPNNWRDKSDLALIGQYEGFTVSSPESKASSAKPNGFLWRVKLANNGFIEFPELTNLGDITLHLAGGAPNEVQVYGVNYDYHYIRIDKKNMDDQWETFANVGTAMPKAEMCKAYTVGCNFADAVKIRIFNASGYSVWVYAMDVTAYGSSSSSDRLPYSFNASDMPKPTSGALPQPANGATWRSALLGADGNGRLVYNADASGFKLPDFSHAGYRNGNAPIPDVAVVKTISPVAGDNTAHIQSAIDQVGAMPLNADGIRGALLLAKGLYEVTGPLYINYDGVVVRGEGNGADPAHNTVVYDSYRDPDGKGAWRSVILMGNKTSDNWDNGKNNVENVLDDVVPVGANSIRISRNENYAVGDLVCIYHPCTDTWLQAINYGEVGDNETLYKPWGTSTAPIYYHRAVTKVAHNGNETLLEFDAPVFYTLRKTWSQSQVWRFNRVAMQHIGLENLRVDCAAKSIPDENHSWNCVGVRNADNCWLRDVAAAHFGQAGFFTERATAVTFERCFALDPVGEVTGERMYNFNQASRSQLILYKECYARGGRHNFVSNGTSTVSGCVVYKCKSEGSRTSSEGHRIWSQGMLFDSYEDFNPVSNSTMLVTLGFYNRWNMGSGHGWAMAHGVMWNCNMRTDHSTPEAQANSSANTRSGIYCEKPPTAQNYAIGCWVENSADIKTYRKVLGYVEGTNQAGLEPASLFEAQLNDRRVATSVPQTPQKGSLAQVTYLASMGALVLSSHEIIEQVDVYNLLGCKVYSAAPRSGHFSLTAANLPNGILLVTLKTKMGTETHKVRVGL